MDIELINLSNTLLFIAFFFYLFASIVMVISVVGKKWSNRNNEDGTGHQRSWGRAGIFLTLGGFVFQSGFYALRWMGQGHAPVSNMFEYMTFLGMMAVLGYIVIYFIYKSTALGAFVLPLAQSYWLALHVSTVAIAQGLFAVAFAGGLMYVIRTVNQKRLNRQNFFLEVFIAIVFMLVGFIIVTSTFKGMGYEVSFEYVNEREIVQELSYTLPAIAGPNEYKQLTQDRMSPIIKTPAWMKGVDAPRKFNTLIWSVLTGTLIYLLFFALLRRRLGAVMQPWLEDLKPSMLDEITYRAIAIAFPIFTLGALIFAMIWAEEAWGRFWGWDPKEVWALITWIFYAVYLHLRLSRGWRGDKSAWLAVAGFIIIMFNLVFVNLIIAGLHSYATGG
jgi:ABC-type transport system involved in cytochrome c biogenesis permease subunit